MRGSLVLMREMYVVIEVDSVCGHAKEPEPKIYCWKQQLSNTPLSSGTVFCHQARTPSEMGPKRDVAGFCDESRKNYSCLITKPCWCENPPVITEQVSELQHVYSLSYWLESCWLIHSHNWTWISCKWKLQTMRSADQRRTKLIEGKQWKVLDGHSAPTLPWGQQPYE